eukprot:CAMPEP_0176486158 /NCGR_PEP_ID=MMETSP0200_2-20121128/5420_1 /TAXON_ID=947934 /ORGANISM="Chaetoceros sp., Strain GSL56" /LENGTH=523 /DNA_ID=CAMNT_0017882843 /DNA_START=114 /DNA_END=1685 /DNA_ORIENTATION=-
MPKLVSLKQEICADCKGINADLFHCIDSTSRFCAKCMIGHKVKIFLPAEEQWYEGSVEEYNQAMGEHKLRYEDGDSEWVNLGELVSGGGAGDGNGGTIPSHLGAYRGMEKVRRDSQVQAPKHLSPPVDDADRRVKLEATQSPRGNVLSVTGLANQVVVDNPNHPQQQQQQQQQHILYSHNGFHSSGGHPSYPHAFFGSHQYGTPMNAVGHSYQGGVPYPPHHGVAYSPHMPHYFPANMTHVPAVSPTNRSSPDKESPPKSGSPNKKNPPKTWSRQEDAQLLSLVQRMQHPVKWSYVAQNMEGRSGKQCRERYVNHLNPLLKHCDWSPIEDATIFHLYNVTGSQWATMSKMIPGRTDNGIKNRFHNLRRQLEREDEQRMRLSKTKDFPDEVRLDKIRVFPKHLRGKADQCWDVFESLGVLAAQSVLGGGLARNASRFGPFRKASETGEQCARCGLYAPSRQCGTDVCSKTNWCIACTRVPPHLCSNVLRECLNLRRVADYKETDKQRTDTESMLKRGALVIAQD